MLHPSGIIIDAPISNYFFHPAIRLILSSGNPQPSANEKPGDTQVPGLFHNNYD